MYEIVQNFILHLRRSFIDLGMLMSVYVDEFKTV